MTPESEPETAGSDGAFTNPVEGLPPAAAPPIAEAPPRPAEAVAAEASAQPDLTSNESVHVEKIVSGTIILTPAERAVLRREDPDSPAVAALMAEKGLSFGDPVQVSVDGREETMQMSRKDLGTELLPKMGRKGFIGRLWDRYVAHTSETDTLNGPGGPGKTWRG